MPDNTIQQIIHMITDAKRRLAALEAQEVETFLSGAGAPAVTPQFVGQWYLDTTGAKWYRATGTTNSSDFKALN